ncbi:MAG TPA: segregation/condensation protein A [Candidatus Bilamarchaeaceae archaeon]|nr:segregation/condensation protein A [Candidatus Bilamarchaeaceae archaeon]
MATEAILERLVEKPTWKEILYGLIETRQLDPWNVDIVALADGFVKKVKELEKLELFIPANMILAASILLRHKSEAVVWEEPAPPPVAYTEDLLLPEELPSLTLASRLQPKRQITVNELVEEIEKTIQYEVIKPPQRRGGIDSFVQLPIGEIDIEKKMNQTYDRLKEMQDEHGWAVFSQLVEKREDVIPVLLSLLYLRQKEKVDLQQEVFFEEILVRVLKPVKQKALSV